MKLDSRFLLTAISMLLLLGSARSSGSPGDAGAQVVDAAAGTTLYVNGDIVTVNDRQPSVEAVAVRDGIILAAGSRAEVEAAAGSDAETRDLQGHALLPGFIDSHGHLTYVNVLQLSANLAPPPVGTARNIADLIALLQAHAEKYPQAPWITGFGYDDSLLAENRHPTRDELDKVSAELPVAITHVSGHLMACNSRCLELAGINADTPDPAGGIIRRRPGGQEPDGVLEETAMYTLRAVMPKADISVQVALLESTQRYYASHGITTAQEGAVDQEGLEVLQRAAEQQKLVLDVVSFPHQSIGLDEVKRYPPTKEYHNHYRVGGIKAHLDGSPQGKTAWLTRPYLHPPHGMPDDYLGYPTLTDEQLQVFVDYAFEDDVPLLAHANGDAAADQLINAVTAARKQFGRADRRTVMIHAQTARDDQIGRMVDEGVIPSYFASHTFFWGDWHRDSVFGEERASRISPLRSSTDKGLRYTLHNDPPVVPPDMR
jgi:predicted amidohydrolase YtcJ